MTKRKRARSLAAKRGWLTRRKRARSLAAKRGMPVEVRSGYAGRGDNSYTLIVHMRRTSNQRDQTLSNLIEGMASKGVFGTSYTWASFHNSFNVTRIRRAPKKPKLVGFERSAP